MKNLCVLLLACMFVLGIALGASAAEIKFAHFYDPMGGQNLEINHKWIVATMDDFMKANPDIKVTEEIYQWDQIDTKSIMDFKANIPHDLMFSSPQLMAKHGYVGDYKEISAYVAKWPEAEQKDFNWSPVWKSGIPGGKQIGVPTGTHTRATVYRRDLFEAAGLDPNKTPKSLDEVVEYAKKLTIDKNGDGEPEQYGLGMSFGPTRATIELYFGPVIWSFGGDLWDPNTKKAIFASEQGVKAAKWLYDLVYTHKVTPKYSISGQYFDVICKDLLEGKVAMAWGYGSYWISQLEQAGLVKGIFPATPEGKAIKADAFVIPGVPQFTNAWLLSIHALSKNPDAAMKLMETVIQPDRLATFADAGLPARLSAWNKPEYQTPFYKTWLEAAKTGRPMPATGYYGELADTIAAAMQEILAKQAPIAETLKKFEDEYNSKYAGE
jgi:ABC-type glycerol-3-phosphate transport system substrate-binding protein